MLFIILFFNLHFAIGTGYFTLTNLTLFLMGTILVQLKFYVAISALFE